MVAIYWQLLICARFLCSLDICIGVLAALGCPVTSCVLVCELGLRPRGFIGRRVETGDMESEGALA